MFKKCLWFFIFAIYSVGFAAWVSPDEALDKMMKGNDRYVSGVTKYSNRSEQRRQKNIDEQKPFAVVLGCSDSRGSPEIIFDQGIGDLFVVRVAGNVVGSVVLASIEYSAVYLESSLIMVMGHQNCGAVKAVLDGTTKDIEAVAELIAPSIADAKRGDGPLLETAIKENVFHTVEILGKNPVLNDLVQKKKLKILGAYYDFHTGKVELLEKP